MERNMLSPQLLCVVPTQWPLAARVVVLSHTWLAGCTRVVLGVSRAQLGATWRPVPMLLHPNASVSATHVSHTTKKQNIWLPVRASIQFALDHNMSGLSWLLLAEDDTYIVMPKLRDFLRLRPASTPLFFGTCACSRSPGANIFSVAAAQRLRPLLAHCEPIQRWRDRPNHTGEALGASDISIQFCLARAGLKCSQALDANGDMLISAMASMQRITLLRLSGQASRGLRFCSPWPCGKQRGCWGAGTFAFHAVPLKQPAPMMAIHSQHTSANVGLASQSRTSRTWHTRNRTNSPTNEESRRPLGSLATGLLATARRATMQLAPA
jgi:hypothetical protein